MTLRPDIVRNLRLAFIDMSGTSFEDNGIMERAFTRTLEKLQEKHETVVRAEEQRAEQVVLDEVAGRRRAAVPAGADAEGDR